MSKDKKRDEAYETLARFDERVNRGTVQNEIETEERRPYGYSYRHLYDIEKFVETIQQGWRGGSILGAKSKGRRRKRWQRADRYYKEIDGWLRRYNPPYRYSSKVEAFYEVCVELRLVGTTIHLFKNPLALQSNGMTNIELFHLVIERVAQRCSSREFKEQERLRINNAKRNECSVLTLEDRMYQEAKGRFLVLSLTLTIQRFHRNSVTLADLQRLRFRFLKARRFNNLMKGIENYVWTLEQGSDTGLHLHFILFYDGKHNHDEYFAHQIGEYWVDVVTEGKGAFWNSNKAWCKDNYKLRGHGVGVGQINWDDEEMRKALRKNLRYLAKAQQHLMVKGEKVHTFGMGKIPTKLKEGRPRKVLDKDAA